MLVKTFDLEKGLYQFQIAQLEGDFHAHPAAEILYAIEGDFRLDTPNGGFEHCQWAIVPANAPHKVNAQKGTFQIVLIEKGQQALREFLASAGAAFEDRVLTSANANISGAVLQNLIAELPRMTYQDRYDPRVEDCLAFLNSKAANYTTMMEELERQTKLSQSRISHLFSAEVGISIQQFLAWSRLKHTIFQSLRTGGTLLECALENGFFDQAHFGKSFKKMMGISPAKIYNSRIVQE